MGFKAALYFVVASVPFFILTIWAIVDALQRDFGSTGRKTLWALIAAVPFVGAPVYLLFGFRRGRKGSSV